MKLSEIATRIGGHVVGLDVDVSGIASIASADASCLTFVDSVKHLQAALESRAAAVIAGEFAEQEIARCGKPLLIAKQPRVAFAQAAKLLVSLPKPAVGVHKTAVIADTARIGRGVAIGDYVVVSENVEIGDDCVIGAHTFIGAGVKIAAGCDIKPNVSIYSGTTLGERVIVHAGAVLGSDGFGFVRDEQSGRYEKFPQVGTLYIGDDAEIGANCTVDRGALDATVIGRGTKLDNIVHVGHNVRIGEDVVIAAQTGISGSAVIEDGAVIAGQVGIADHVTIGSGAIMGAQCGVPSGKIIRGKGVLFWGTPARPIRQYLKELAVLARLAEK